MSVGSGSIQITDNYTESLEQTSCKYHGDAILDASPTNFKEALKVYKEFPRLSKESKHIVFYSLSPITKYCGDEDLVLINELSPELTARVREIITKMETTELMIINLSEFEVAKEESTTLGQILYDFLKDFKQFNRKWTTRLSYIYKDPVGVDHPDKVGNVIRLRIRF